MCMHVICCNVASWILILLTKVQINRSTCSY